jgi:hypothetical protein
MKLRLQAQGLVHCNATGQPGQQIRADGEGHKDPRRLETNRLLIIYRHGQAGVPSLPAGRLIHIEAAA